MFYFNSSMKAHLANSLLHLYLAFMVRRYKNFLQMIENNLVHFIASDAHHDTKRPFIMESLFKDKS